MNMLKNLEESFQGIKKWIDENTRTIDSYDDNVDWINLIGVEYCKLADKCVQKLRGMYSRT